MRPVLVTANKIGAVRGERVLFGQVSFEVRAGEALLLRGKNGSGKTTLLRQLAGLSSPASGAFERQSQAHWIGHANGLKAHETPKSHLQHWARVWGAGPDVGEILRQMAMTRPANVPCRMLSAGQKRRTALGRLHLIHRDLWLLDEPFNALDRDGQALLARMIQDHRARGGAVIAALHGEAPIEASSEVVL